MSNQSKTVSMHVYTWQPLSDRHHCKWRLANRQSHKKLKNQHLRNKLAVLLMHAHKRAADRMPWNTYFYITQHSQTMHSDRRIILITIIWSKRWALSRIHMEEQLVLSSAQWAVSPHCFYLLGFCTIEWYIGLVFQCIMVYKKRHHLFRAVWYIYLHRLLLSKNRLMQWWCIYVSADGSYKYYLAFLTMEHLNSIIYIANVIELNMI